MEILRVFFTALPSVIALVAAVLLVVFVFFAFRSSGFGMGSVFSLFIFQAVFPGFQGINLGVRIDALDLVTLMLGLVVLMRFAFVAEARHGLLTWYLFVACVLFSLVSGLVTQGTAGGVAARPYFYGIVTCSYALTFRGDIRLFRQLLGGMAWSGLALFALVMMRWVITYLPIPALLPPGGQFASVEASLLRVVPSGEAMLLAQVVVVGLFFPALVPALRWLRAAMPLFLVMVLALQHRSVWAAFLAAVGARFALPQAGRKASMQLAAAALVLAVMAVPVALSGKFAGATADIGRSASRALALSDTVNFRFDTWKFTIGKWAGSGPLGLVAGLPMGTPMDRVLRSDEGNYTQVSVSAHNYFVQTLFNTGLLGLLAIVWVYGVVILNLVKGLRQAEFQPACSLMLLLLAAQLAYYVAYGVNFVQGLILGVAAALAMEIRRRMLLARARSASPWVGAPGGGGYPAGRGAGRDGMPAR